MTPSDHAAPGPGWVPDACTLPTAEQPLRLAEFDDLFTNHLANSQRISRTHLRLNLTGPQGLKAIVEDLAARESQCCSFFGFTVTATEPGRLLFDIEVPETQTDVLDALADRTRSAR